MGTPRDDVGGKRASAADAGPSERLAARIGQVVAALALAVAGLQSLANTDTFGHLAQGRQIAKLGHVPNRDTLSFWQPEPAPWLNYEWLSDLWSWSIFDLGGANALIVFHCALLAAGAALLVLVAQRHAGPRAAVLCALLLVVAIPAARFRLSARPHLFALPLAALYLVGLASLLREASAARRGAVVAWIAALTLAHAAWVNLHGSHLLGLGLTLVHFGVALRVPHARARIGTLLGLQLAASCISPFGPAIAFDAIEHVADPAYRDLVIEWGGWQPEQPPWLFVAPILQTLLLAVAVVPLWRRGLAARALFVCTVLLAIGALRSVRFIGEYMLLSAPALAIAGATWLRAAPWRRVGGAVGVASVLAAVAVPVGAAHLPPHQGIGLGMITTGVPAASAAWLRGHAAAPRIFAAVDDSWYLAFGVPEARFFIDGRLPFYGPEHIQRLRLAFASPAVFAHVLEAYRIDTVVVRHAFAAHRGVLDAVRARPGWMLATIEDLYSVYVREDLPTRAGATLTRSALNPGYEMAWLVNADAARERVIRADLARLPDHPNTVGYRAWVNGVLALRPFLRDGGRAGVRPPVDTAERAMLKRVLGELRRTAQGAPGVPIVHAEHAVVAAALCELDEAEGAMQAARAEHGSRESLFVEQEIALRRGHAADVQAFLDRARALPEAAGDPWLEALQRELASPPPSDVCRSAERLNSWD